MNNKILVSSTFAGLFIYAMIGTLFGLSAIKIMADFKLDFALAGLVISAFSLGGALSALQGKYVDKYGFIRLSRISTFGMAFATILMGLSENIFLLYIFSFINGVASGVYESSYNQIILCLYPRSKGAMVTITHGFYGLGAIFGPIFTVALITRFESWRIGYVLFGTALLIITFLQLFLKRAEGEIKGAIQQGNIEKIDYRLLLSLSIALFLTVVIGVGVNAWLPTYLVRTDKVSYFESSIVLSCFWGTLTFGRFFIGRIADRRGFKKILTFSAIFGTLCGSISIFAHGLFLNLIVWGLMGLAQSSYYPLIVAIAYDKFRNSPGSAIGKVVAVSYLGSLIVTPLIGALSEFTNPDIATLLVPVASLALGITFLKSKI